MHMISFLRPMQYPLDIRNLDQRHAHIDSIVCNNPDYCEILYEETDDILMQKKQEDMSFLRKKTFSTRTECFSIYICLANC